MPSLLAGHLLLRLLKNPDLAAGLSLPEWESVIRSARRTNLLCRLACLVAPLGNASSFPERVRDHLESALCVAESNRRSVLWEVRQIRKALQQERIPFVLLKGAAYIAGGFAPAPGRLLSDIDIMVQRERLEDTEKVLFEHGWLTTKLDAYDQRYYRQWMHELPPLQHLDRGTSLDVHHTILPPTADSRIDARKLWEHIVDVPGFEGVHVLCRADMVLHSATHLFHEGEWENGLRDLVDIDALLGEFSQVEGFWEDLLARASELDLNRSLYYALRYCRMILDTPMPPEAFAQLESVAAPPWAILLIMDALVLNTVGAHLERRTGALVSLAGFALYLRSHYLRMPMYLLIPHLLRKQFASGRQ